MGWTICHEFTDVVTGTKSKKDRPQFKRMFELASRREFDLVLFWALDRFSREGVLPRFQFAWRAVANTINLRPATPVRRFLAGTPMSSAEFWGFSS